MPARPTGETTFLFTDIEGSTRLWEGQPDAMDAALVRHDTIVRDGIEGHGGHVFKTVGDSFCAVFTVAPAAVAAAAEIQRALAAEDWRDVGEIRVRMGLHTGASRERGSDYFGPTVNRVARLHAVAHGGQIVLSQSAEDQVRDALPEGVSLLDLGEHRLRDLSRREHIYQVQHADLRGAFPPLNTVDSFPNNLPVLPTSFVGREPEIAAVKDLLASTRVLTLTGFGGSGKTRLALQVGGDVLRDYADGAWLTELAPVVEEDQVARAVASTLGLQEQRDQPILETVVEYLADRELLLILDNCEHLIPACAEVSDALIRRCPGLRILATSRQVLGMFGELVFSVPPMSPPSSQGTPDPEELCESEAALLFVDRASLRRPDFEINPSTAPAIGRICSRLEGNPLAIEMAAARVRLLSVEQVADRLDERFRLLTGGSRTALPHQQTLRATMDWSYDLLDRPERKLLRRLAAFAGGWSIEAAEDVCAGDGIDGWEVVDHLEALLDKSLVEEMHAEGTSRHRLLATVHEYAHEKLVGSGEAEMVLGRHLEHFTDFAGAATQELDGPDQLDWRSRLDKDHANVTAAIEWATGHDRCEDGLRLASSMWGYWHVRGYWDLGQRLLRQILGVPAAADYPAIRADALTGRGTLLWAQGNYDAASASFEAGLAIQLALGNEVGIARLHNNLGNLASDRGDYESARRHYVTSLDIERRLAVGRGVGRSLHNLGVVEFRQGDYESARVHLTEALARHRERGDDVAKAYTLGSLGEVATADGDADKTLECFEASLVAQREIGDKGGIGWSLHNLGKAACDQGLFGIAEPHLAESLDIERQLGNKRGIARTLHCQGQLARARGDIDESLVLHHESLRLDRDLGNTEGIAESIEQLALTYVSSGQPRRSAQLMGAAATARTDIAAPVPPGDSPALEAALDICRRALGDEQFENAYGSGAAMSVDEAADYAIGLGAASPR